MIHLFRGLQFELLKLKRTLALGMVVLAPLVVVMLELIVFTARREDYLIPQSNPWQLMQSVIGLWGLLMLPLLITLEAALLAALEHGNAQWKQLFAQPVPRWSYFVTKLVTTLLLIGASTLVLGAGIQLGGLLLRAIEPEMASGPLMWGDLGRLLGFTFVASWLTVTLHTWLSLRWSNFTVCIGAGVAATVIGFVAVGSDRLLLVYPWTLPLNVLKEGTPLIGLMLYSLTGTLVVGAFGCWRFVRRDVL